MQSLSRRPDGSTVLTVSGRVDADGASRLARLLHPATMPTTHLVLDMSGVTVLGAEGLAVLVDTSARLREHGGRLTIAIGDRLGAVLRAVEDARLERTLPLFDTVEHALAAPATREPATQ